VLLSRFGDATAAGASGAVIERLTACESDLDAID
jgi:hypothetical protein